MNKLFVSILATIFVASTASAGIKLVNTTDKNALCNDGSQANFTVVDNGHKNWMVMFQGGGIAGNPDEYKNRDNQFKTKARGPHDGQYWAISKDMMSKGYNFVFIPYCSSDLFQGNHTHKISGKTVHFKGRVIVENIFEMMDSEFSQADKLIVYGYSAGAIGLGFNADIFAKYDPYVIPDGFFFDKKTHNWYANVYGPKQKQRLSWIYKNMPNHCDSWHSCFPSISKFSEHGIDNVFIIWNVGDKYGRFTPKKDLTTSIKSVINHYDAGFSVDAEKRKLDGYEDWGHVTAPIQSEYTRKYGNNTLQLAIENWLSGSGNAVITD